MPSSFQAQKCWIILTLYLRAVPNQYASQRRKEYHITTPSTMLGSDDARDIQVHRLPGVTAGIQQLCRTVMKKAGSHDHTVLVFAVFAVFCTFL